MQVKKILILLVLCFAIAMVALYTIPIERDYNAEIEINSNNVITYRTLLDTSNWNKWYSENIHADADPSNLQLQKDKAYKRFDYKFNASANAAHEGQVRVTKSNRWNTKIKWTEKVTLDKGIKAKLHLIFHTSEFRTAFLQNVLQFKNFVEHPEDTYGGLTFRRRNIPANKLITINDTIPFSQMEARLPELYARLSEKISPEQVKQQGQYFSQHEMMDDSLAHVRVGVIVTDEMLHVDKPYDLLDMDEHQAIVMQITSNYAEINEDISVMYDWLKKNESRPAAGFWIEHAPNKSIAQANAPRSLTVIQEVYSIK